MHILDTHTAIIQETPIRIQEYGIGIFKTIPTRSALKKAIKKKRILVNGSPVTTAKMIVGGEMIALIDAKENLPKKQLEIDLEVIFEDDHLAIINKPAGILVSGNSFKTIDNALPQNIKKSTSKDVVRPRPVHRLDYPTTGLLIIGKTSSSILALNKLFEHTQIQKTYYAVTIGNMKPEGSISSSIEEKEAYSKYKVLASVTSERFQQLNLVQLSPKTGRRHQLRKHLSSIGHPILGDKEYGKKDMILKGKGLYLHAASLAFTHPITKENMCFKSQLPNKFSKIFPSALIA